MVLIFFFKGRHILQIGYFHTLGLNCSMFQHQKKERFLRLREVTANSTGIFDVFNNLNSLNDSLL